jgi:threonine synthase
VPTQGNAGVAASLFSSRMGLPPAMVYMPEGHRGSWYHRASELLGATVTFHGENIAGTGARMREDLADELASGAAVDISTFFEPGRLEGKKTLGLEIFEQLGADGLPDAIFYPTGGGTGLVGIWKALEELRALGLVREDQLPRMYAVQSERCCPVVRSFERGLQDVEPVTSEGTAADGLDVPGAIMGPRMLQLLRASKGGGVAVTESAISTAYRDLNAHGIVVGLEAAATLAALRDLRASGQVASGERVLLLLTGGYAPFAMQSP